MVKQVSNWRLFDWDGCSYLFPPNLRCTVFREDKKATYVIEMGKTD